MRYRTYRSPKSVVSLVHRAENAWREQGFVPESHLQRMLLYAQSHVRVRDIYSFFESYLRPHAAGWVHRQLKAQRVQEDTRDSMLQHLYNDAYAQVYSAVRMYEPHHDFVRLYRTLLYQAELRWNNSKIPALEELLAQHHDPCVLADAYADKIKSWVAYRSRDNPRLNPSDISAVGVEGFWKAARNAVHLDNFWAYARRYMDGELSRFRKNEQSDGLQLGRFDNDDNFIDTIADTHTNGFTGEYACIADEINQKAVVANRKLGVFHASEKVYGNDMRLLFRMVTDEDQELLHEGESMVQERLGYRRDAAALLYQALMFYATVDGNTMREWKRSWRSSVTNLLERFSGLPSGHQAAVAVFGLSQRGRAQQARPIRMGELRYVGKMLGMTTLDRNPKERWVYDPFLGRRVHLLVDDAFYGRVDTMISSVFSSRFDKIIPGLQKAVIDSGLRPIPCRGLYDDDGSRYYTLLDSAGRKSSKLLVIPSDASLIDFNMSINCLADLTEKGEIAIPRVYEIGSFAGEQQSVPFAIVGAGPREPRIGRWEKEPLLSTVKGIYRRILEQGVVPPAPTYLNLLFPRDPTKLVIGGVHMWRPLTTSVDAALEDLFRRAGEEITEEETAYRFKDPIPF